MIKPRELFKLFSWNFFPAVFVTVNFLWLFPEINAYDLMVLWIIEGLMLFFVGIWYISSVISENRWNVWNVEDIFHNYVDDDY